MDKRDGGQYGSELHARSMGTGRGQAGEEGKSLRHAVRGMLGGLTPSNTALCLLLPNLTLGARCQELPKPLQQNDGGAAAAHGILRGSTKSGWVHHSSNGCERAAADGSSFPKDLHREGQAKERWRGEGDCSHHANDYMKPWVAPDVVKLMVLLLSPLAPWSHVF